MGVNRSAGNGSSRAQAVREVLVVDDNPVVRATACSLFEDLGFTVHDAYCGEQALRIIAAHSGIEILFVDIRMPGMTGPDLARHALARRPDLKVVFTSGYVDGTELPPAAPFVPKPWRVDQVVNALADVPSS
jgi:CheY-like chemotaxis protein